MDIFGNSIEESQTSQGGAGSNETTEPFLHLSKDSTSDTKDAGFYIQYEDGGTKYAGIVRDATDKRYYMINGLTSKPIEGTNYGGNLANINIADLSSSNITSSGVISADKPPATDVFPLDIGGVNLGNKACLYCNPGVGNYGLGIQSGFFELFTDTNAADFRFGYGSNSGSVTETLRIDNGLSGIVAKEARAADGTGFKITDDAGVNGVHVKDTGDVDISISGKTTTVKGLLGVDENIVTGAIANIPSGTLSVGTNDAQSLLLKTNNTTAITVDSSQNANFAGVISADKTPATDVFPIEIGDAALGNKVCLYCNPGFGNYGFGIQPFTFELFTDTVDGDFSFGHGSNSGAITETLRIDNGLGGIVGKEVRAKDGTGLKLTDDAGINGVHVKDTGDVDTSVLGKITTVKGSLVVDQGTTLKATTQQTGGSFVQSGGGNIQTSGIVEAQTAVDSPLIFSSGVNQVVGTNTAHTLALKTNNINRLTIDSAGAITATGDFNPASLTTSTVDNVDGGSLTVKTSDSQAVVFQTNNTTALTLNTSQNAIFNAAISAQNIDVPSGGKFCMNGTGDANWCHGRNIYTNDATLDYNNHFGSDVQFSIPASFPAASAGFQFIGKAGSGNDKTLMEILGNGQCHINWGNLDIDQGRLNTLEVRAKDGTGLKLTDDAGVNGVHVKDTGDVDISIAGKTTTAKGDLTALGVISADKTPATDLWEIRYVCIVILDLVIMDSVSKITLLNYLQILLMLILVLDTAQIAGL
jgi:hypothetical protein